MTKTVAARRSAAAPRAAGMKIPLKVRLGLRKTAKKATRRPKKATPLIGKGEPKSFRVENPRGPAPCLIVCDHASNRVPKSLGTLGLSRKNLQKHIAWDPGTETISQYLSLMLGAAAVFSCYSRLVADVNRGEDSPECMRAVSDHIHVPGNRNLTEADKKQRLKEFFWPYHRAITRRLDIAEKRGQVPLIIAIHSFTPQMDGFKRPWHLGVLWNKEGRIARQLIKALRRDNPEIVIGENEPYSLKEESKLGRLAKNTIGTHAEDRGLPYVIIEVRQDLIDTPAKAKAWGARILPGLQEILDDARTYAVRPDKSKKRPAGKNAAKKKTVRKKK